MDKRRYQREKLGIPGNFYIQGFREGDNEFTGIIDNISEVGILVNVSGVGNCAIADELTIGSEMKFLSMDEYVIFEQKKRVYVTGTASVVRKEINNGLMSFGCELKGVSHALEKYISDIKICSFQNRGYRLAEY